MERGAIHLAKKTLKTILLANQEKLTYGQEARMRAFQEDMEDSKCSNHMPCLSFLDSPFSFST